MINAFAFAIRVRIKTKTETETKKKNKDNFNEQLPTFNAFAFEMNRIYHLMHASVIWMYRICLDSRVPHWINDSFFHFLLDVFPSFVLFCFVFFLPLFFFFMLIEIFEAMSKWQYSAVHCMRSITLMTKQRSINKMG